MKEGDEEIGRGAEEHEAPAEGDGSWHGAGEWEAGSSSLSTGAEPGATEEQFGGWEDGTGTEAGPACAEVEKAAAAA